MGAHQESEAAEFNWVLIVNDDEIFNEITEYTLAKSGITGAWKSMLDPAEALRFLDGCADFPELILLDMNMPLMNAFQFLDRFRAAGHHQRRTMVVLFSTLIFDGDYERALAIDCVSGYYTKPLELKHFKEIQHLFQSRFGSGAAQR